MDHSSRPIRSLVEWVEARDDVRAALLVGSRAPPDARPDPLSDYDVLLFVRDTAGYEESDAWLDAFGSVLVMLREEYELAGRTVQTRLVQYDDGLRIDFTLCATDILTRIAREPRLPDVLDAGYRILVDKDGELSALPPATGSAHVPSRPTEPAYRRVVDEFWWEVIYVAKHLARGDVLPARYNSECVLRFQCLVPMLEWYVEAGYGWRKPLGPYGAGLTDLLAERDRRMLARTYAGAAKQENWNALFAMMELFARLARAVALDLGFADPSAVGRKVEVYVREIRQIGPFERE